MFSTKLPEMRAPIVIPTHGCQYNYEATPFRIDMPSTLVAVKASRWARMYDVAGVMYLVASMGLSVVALFLSSEYLANDLFWPTLPSSSASFAAVFNNKLVLEAAEPILDVTQAVLAPSVVGSFSPVYPRPTSFTQNTASHHAAHGHRHPATSQDHTKHAQQQQADHERHHDSQ
ncbi:hypothetical protein SDRG_01104 [Saprolegnia diclina VS20]|uniref:Uncharacterized protein n=1 Tax=Saprolegnia diclina (strain VS20) TaxID=1156394 RepID=T0R456_SAPDV|nr:hypothetical protein SDRG_01104 [Saprolegnia diclina VS20]EQC41125.1 hypothetical protein SDRG_01104 [Saprolegnia diclina VS20]|eukprot:XP_008604839.1 hypothetical protein SDRG_01104 [Saprolegnia diclina VS20]